ncbi:MAG: helix-turn-helix transcriptional regulator [Proteobacteria bacterium]|nr:helix-turn-helix transcriptional regulator [Pseudomonadota bacterium]
MELSRFIDENGRPRSEMADRFGVSVSYLSRLERGERIPGRDVMARIVHETGGAVQPNDFFDLPDQDTAACRLWIWELTLSAR